MHCRLGLVTVGRYSILRVQKLHIVGNNYLCWKGLDSKGLNVFLKDVVVLASLFYLSCWRVFHSFSFKSHHQKFLFYCNRPTDQRKQANDSVLQRVTSPWLTSSSLFTWPQAVVVHTQSQIFPCWAPYPRQIVNPEAKSMLTSCWVF